MVSVSFEFIASLVSDGQLSASKCPTFHTRAVTTHLMKYLFYLLCLLIISCNHNKVNDDWDKDNTRSIDVNNNELKASIDTVRYTINDFIKHFELNSKDTSMNYFVKYGFSNSQTKEHMWVDVILINDKIVGLLDNVPQYINTVKYLDTVYLDPTQIEDYQIYHGDTLLYGDFLNKYLTK